MRALLQFNKKSLFLLSLLLNLLVALSTIAAPLVSQRFIDAAIAKNSQSLIIFACLSLGLGLLTQILYYITDRVQGQSEEWVWENLAKQTEKNIHHYDPTAGDLSPEEIHQQLGQNFERLQNFFNLYPTMLIIYSLRILLTLGILFLISPLVTLLVVTLVPFFLLISHRYGEKLAQVGQNTLKAMQEARTYLVDLCRWRVPARFQQKSIFRPFIYYLRNYREKKQRQVKATAYFDNFLSYASLNLMILLTAIITGVQTYQGQITVGLMYAANLYVSQIWGPIDYLIDIYKAYAGHRHVISAFLQFMQPQHVTMVEAPIPQIKLLNYFGLDHKGKPLHQAINYTFRSGDITVITGGNGVGKTQLILAILGFQTHFAGQIHLPHFQRNKNFSYCPANVLASPFFKSEIRRGGSMGQLKKHALATTLEANKDVYIFDEPGNYLDKERKEALKATFTDLAKHGKIVILISHEPEIIPPGSQELYLEKINQ